MRAGPWQRIEGALVLISVAGVLWALGFGFPFWQTLLIFAAPELARLARVFGPRIGAFAYNVTHLYGFGAVIVLFGLLYRADAMMICGMLWVANTGFCRMPGYGLKRSDSMPAHMRPNPG